MKRAIQNDYMLLLLLSLILICPQCKKDKTDPPSLSSVSPASGIAGDPVTVTGSNLQNADKVTFGGKSSVLVQVGNTSITTVVPNGATAGINKITVSNSGGSSNELDFEVFTRPEVYDSLPPTLTKTIPSSNYNGYPVLIYGDFLSGVLSVTFNGKPAEIFTNNQKVITTIVPNDLPAGSVKIKVKTVKGEDDLDFQVLGASPTGPADATFSIVDIPPPNYVAEISNDWSCGLFDGSAGDSTFVQLFTDDNGDRNYKVTGRYEYNFDKARDYSQLNYVEFTNKETGETFAGQFSATKDKPCVLKMVLISSKTGIISTCTFDQRDLAPDCQP